jgi:hypothetical protein
VKINRVFVNLPIEKIRYSQTRIVPIALFGFNPQFLKHVFALVVFKIEGYTKRLSTCSCQLTNGILGFLRGRAFV